MEKERKALKKVVKIDKETGRPYVIDHETGKKISPAGWEMKYGKPLFEVIDKEAVKYGLFRNIAI